VQHVKFAACRPTCSTSSARIEAHARSYGLDFWGVSFEVLDYKRMQEGGRLRRVPVRYPHWRFGM